MMPDVISIPAKIDTSAEVKRLTSASEQSLKLSYLISIVVMTSIGVSAIVAITMLRPERDNTSLIAIVIGAIVPTTTALLAMLRSAQTAADVQDIHVRINSRMDQLLEATGAAERAKGLAQGKEEGTPQAVPGAVPVIEVTKPTMVVPETVDSVVLAVEAEKESLKVEP